MFNRYNFGEGQQPPDQDDYRTIPDYDSEFDTAKMFLQKCSTLSGDNLYDHLAEVLDKILAERPENVVDFFEEYSRQVKENRYKSRNSHLEDIYETPARLELCNRFMSLFKPLKAKEDRTVDPEDEDLADMTRNDMLQLTYFFEQVGLGLPRQEMFLIMLAMRQLIHTEPITSIRFWGKIYGLYKNYIIVECDLKEEEYAKRNQEIEDQQTVAVPPPENPEQVMDQALEKIAQDQEQGNDEEEGGKATKFSRSLPPPPLNLYEEPPEPPNEPSGVGVNTKVYYVCNEPGNPWILLPDVTARQIRVSRQIKRSFTGNLDTDIYTYPHFPGTERNYLRAQIARISAGTQISPLGFYTFGGEEGGEEEEEAGEEQEDVGPKTTYNENPRFEPLALRDLTDISMSFWVHHTLYILPQGRTTWWNPNPVEDLGEEVGEEEEADKKPEGPEPEIGPSLLTPLSEDASLETVPPWSVRTSCTINEYSLAIIRSNLWHGAYCFCNQGKIFHNVYLGNGHKYMATNFSPAPLTAVEQDYPIGPEIMEIIDPLGRDEEQWRIDHLPKPKPVAEEGEEEAEEEEEEEDEDD